MEIFSSATLIGIDGKQVDVEVDITPGMGQFTIVGLGDTAVQESRERIRSALKNSGFSFPGGARITVNLAPGDLRKKGPLYDVPIALGIIGKNLSYLSVFQKGSLFLGELSLSGEIKKVTGVLPATLLARELKKKYIFVPLQNYAEASVVPDICVIPVRHLRQAVAILTGKEELPSVPSFIANISTTSPKKNIDFGEIHGQEPAKRACMIAAAGGHNILFQGPPGSGKTMLAKALVSILPPLELEEKIEISRIYSVIGGLSENQNLIHTRPFRAVHHTASNISLIGGGRDARPGEISLAHKGILFLDELLEFPQHTLDMLRQPLEDGYITINRAQQSAKYPSNFSLIGAMNPCPCGFLGDKEQACTCSQGALTRYRAKLSGPLLDRIDLFLSVPRVKISELTQKASSNTKDSDFLRKNVLQAHLLQKKRFTGTTLYRNADMSNKDIQNFGFIQKEAEDIALKAMDTLKISTRAYYKVLRIARTIADIDTSHDVEVRHMLEALSYRSPIK